MSFDAVKFLEIELRTVLFSSKGYWSTFEETHNGDVWGIPNSVVPTKPPVFFICYLLDKEADCRGVTSRIQTQTPNLYLELTLVNASGDGSFITLRDIGY